MLDINFIRENKDLAKKGLKARLFPKVDLIDRVIKLDDKVRELRIEVEELRAKRNKASSEKNIELGRKIKEELSLKEPDFATAEKDLGQLLKSIPNIPAEGVPEGPEENKKLIRKVGEPKKFDFETKDHLALGEALGIIDVERGAKVSGTRFSYLKGDGALLELALVSFAFEKLVKKGFAPVFPPMLIKQGITEGLGYWNGGGNENYYYVSDFEKGEGEKELQNPLYLVGTGEHSVVPLHKDEILSETELPRKYAAFSGCFRREAGSYGKDTRGILRVHQFDKVEMVVFAKPEDEEEIHKEMLSNSEELMKELELPYQVVELAAGDIGFPTAKTLDIETWMPGQGKYRETHSISTTTDYQARGLNIKYKTKGGNKFVYILNGTAFAIGRTIIAILENFQQEDGSVLVPKVLQKSMGKEKIGA